MTSMDNVITGGSVARFLTTQEQQKLRMISRRWYFTSSWLQYDPARPLSKKSALNLESRSFQHVWHQFVKAEGDALREELLLDLPLPCKKETHALKAGLCESTNTGVRPSFENAHARSGYTADKMNRCGNLPNVLLTREMQDVRAELFGSYARRRHWQVALYGGGPGYDSIGLLFLRKFLRAEKQVTFHTNVYDNEPGWSSVITGVSRSLHARGYNTSAISSNNNSCIDTWSFKACDITEAVSAAVNSAVAMDASTTDLFVFSFVCVENYRLLVTSAFAFLRSLSERARVGTYFFFMDSTHRLWPVLWEVARTTATFRVWAPHARGCHYALVLQKLHTTGDPTRYPFFHEAMARFATFSKHQARQWQEDTGRATITQPTNE